MNEGWPLIVILGPTASGKSDLGIRIARHLNGEVIACDSTQIYRRFDIGTAKVRQQQGVLHHLVDLIDPQEVFTAGEYRRCAVAVLADIRRRSKIPIVTAGTGLYLRALLEGLADAPARSEELRARLRHASKRKGPAYLNRLLRRLDRDAAARIDGADIHKLIRAIEMRLLSGKPLSEIYHAGRQKLEGYDVIKIGLRPPRDELYSRTDARVHAMIRAGWVEEVRQLIGSGVPVHVKPFQFIGYSQMRDHLEGRLSLEEAVKRVQQETRRFAKRQITWFRKEPNVHWLSNFGDNPEILPAVLRVIRENFRNGKSNIDNRGSIA